MELRLLRYFVVVAEEQNVARAADRLGMTQPPLSRAIRTLERQLGTALFERSPRGMQLTAAGIALRREARPLLDRVERLPMRVAAAAGRPAIAVGTCADTADQIGSRLVTEFRRRHPEVELTLHETDLTDPTAGLRTDLVDVALTRRPFDESGLAARVLRRDPLGVVVLHDDPLATRPAVSTAEVAERRWIRLPEGTDPLWRAYWMAGASPDDALHDVAGGGVRPVVRTIQEALMSVLWSKAATMAPHHQVLPDGLVNVPLTDKPASEVVVAWKPGRADPLVSAFVSIAVATFPA